MNGIDISRWSADTNSGVSLNTKPGAVKTAGAQSPVMRIVASMLKTQMTLFISFILIISVTGSCKKDSDIFSVNFLHLQVDGITYDYSGTEIQGIFNVSSTMPTNGMIYTTSVTSTRPRLFIDFSGYIKQTTGPYAVNQCSYTADQINGPYFKLTVSSVRSFEVSSVNSNNSWKGNFNITLYDTSSAKKTVSGSFGFVQ